MPRGQKIYWKNYRKKWQNYEGSLKQFCIDNNLNYGTARTNLRTRDKKQINDKKNEIIEKVVKAEIIKQATQEGLELARIYTEQKTDLKRLKKLKELTNKKLTEIEKKAKKEGVESVQTSQLVELSLIIDRACKATKTIIDYMGERLNLNATIDPRLEAFMERNRALSEKYGNVAIPDRERK